MGRRSAATWKEHPVAALTASRLVSLGKKHGVLTHDVYVGNSVVDPDPDWIRIQWGPRIRIPKIKKLWI